MSQFNTYPGPKENGTLGQRGGKKARNGSSHSALGNQKATRGKTVSDGQGLSYSGKADSYYGNPPSMPEKQ